MISKKCAICFSGQVRTGERKSVLENIKTNLIEPYIQKNYEIFYFGACEKSYNGYNWTDFSIIEDNNFWGNDIENYDKKLGSGVKGGSFNVMNQWKKCQEVGLLKKQFEDSKNFKFDAVIRIRPDIVLYEKLEIESLNMEGYNIPNHDNWGGYNDRLCIGSSQSMDYYMINFVDKIKEYFFKDLLYFHSETLLKHHIDKTGTKINRPNFTIRFERDFGTDVKNFTLN